MTREIKFRAWDKKDKRMYEPFPLDWLKEKSDRPTNWNEGINFDESIIFLQYTGLKDKNGKEIYFGDVVEAVGKSLGENHPAYDEIRGAGKQKLYCECDPHYLRIRFTQKPNGLFEFNSHELEEIEVIGNICENPELLKP